MTAQLTTLSSQTKTLYDNEDCVILPLIPFSIGPKLHFNEVQIGFEATKIIRVENPNLYLCKVLVTNLPPIDRNLKLSWTEVILNPQSAVDLNLTWIPKEEGSWRDVLYITDSRKLKWVISIVYRSTTKVKKQTSVRSKLDAVVSSFQRPLQKYLSPKSLRKSAPSKLNTLTPLKSQLAMSQNHYVFECNKENSPLTTQISSNNKEDLSNSLSVLKILTNVNLKCENISKTTLDEKDSRLATQSFSGETHMNSPVLLNEFWKENSLKNKYSTKLRQKTELSEVTVSRKELFKSDGILLESRYVTTSTYTVSNNNLELLSPASQTDFNNLLSNKSSTSTPILTNYKKHFSGVNACNALSSITEKDSNEDITVNSVKHKNDSVRFDLSPPKKPILHKVPKTGIFKKKINPLNLKKRFSLFSKTSTKTNSFNPFLSFNLCSTTSDPNLDPFQSVLYFNESWVLTQIDDLKKWLNALLTPPSELSTSDSSKKLDLVKLWQESIKQSLTFAPTKEKVSSLYHTSAKLESLRRAARNLYQSSEIQTVLEKVEYAIEKQQISIRKDKDLHLDIGLQSYIMSLFLSYNPLWLRIGLETIYNETLPLENNSDITGLSTFILLRFFRNPQIIPRTKGSLKHNLYLPKYAVPLKRFMLKKFFMLVYFLDQAKTRKLIAHDPCLFCRNSEIKESKELLICFSRELLSAMGDITRFLHRLGYDVSYKQSNMDEFSFAVKDLFLDLRDGIRLTRAMEIILMKPNLMSQLRVRAISRLQKIYNVKVAMSNLELAGFEICGNITPKDIADGNREKTLSFLWQIIYKFQAPLFTNSAVKIQLWWRSLKILKRRNILRAQRKKLEDSAIKIQRWFRARKGLLLEQQKFFKLKKAAIVIQRHFKAWLLMKRDKTRYVQILNIIIRIQQKFRFAKLTQEQRMHFLNLKNATIKIQRCFRAKILKIKTRNYYRNLKKASIVLQRYYRARLAMKKERMKYINQRNIILKMQQRFRAKQVMRKEQATYITLKKYTASIQRRFRVTLVMKTIRKNYLQLKQATIIIQRHFIAYKYMKNARNNYLHLKSATIHIQRRFRANLLTKKTRHYYLQQKAAIVIIQQRFRANLAMKIGRNDYLHLKAASVVIQQRFRANIVAKNVTEYYMKQKKAVILLQQRYRANIIMKILRLEYLSLKNSTIIIQRIFRAIKQMKQTRENYLQQKKSAVIIQQRFRATATMKKVRKTFLRLKFTIIVCQRRFRANKLMNQIKSDYLQIKKATLVIQQYFRATKDMKIEQRCYHQMRNATITIQQRFRANQMMRQTKYKYVQLKNATLTIQTHFRAFLEMKKVRNNYFLQIKTTVFLQQKFRANLTMKQIRNQYLSLKNSCIIIQKYFRAKLIKQKMRNKKKALESLEVQRLLSAAAIKIQARWRGYRVRSLDNEQMSSIRQRSTIANMSALPENTLEQRTLEAIESLTIISSMKELIKVLSFLDFTTRLYPSICVDYCDRILEFIYALLASANRSTPNIEACVLTTSILINLYKYKPTSSAVIKVKHVDNLLNLLLHFSDKDDLLFPNTCTLLWIAAHNKDIRAMILNENNANKRLIKAYTQCERRQRMLAKMRNRTDIEKKCVLPSLNPDWGFVNKKHPRTFQDHFFAIKCLLKKLTVDLEH